MGVKKIAVVVCVSVVCAVAYSQSTISRPAEKRPVKVMRPSAAKPSPNAYAVPAPAARALQPPMTPAGTRAWDPYAAPYATYPTPVRPATAGDRIDSAESEGLKLDLLKKAAACLEAAGMTQESQRVREEIKKKKQALAKRLETLEKEVQDLKRILGKDTQVSIRMRVLEMDADKLTELGFDFTKFNPNGSPGGDMASLPSTCSIVDQDARPLKTLDTLLQADSVRVVAEPALLALNGKLANLRIGSEVPIARPRPNGTSVVELQEVGTKSDVLPTVLDNGRVRLEIRCRTSKLAAAADKDATPTLDVQSIDTAIEMKAGQTCILAGLVEKRPSKEDASPEDKEEPTKDIATVFLVTPTLVDPAAVRTGEAVTRAATLR